MAKKYWFWAWITEITLPKGRLPSAKQKGEVWRNLVLVSACSENEAIRKVEKIGADLEGDSRGSLTLDGQPAVTKFIGIENMGLIHDLVFNKLSDGTEILFIEYRTSLALAQKRVRDNKAIAMSLRKELQPYVNLRKISRTDAND